MSTITTTTTTTTVTTTPPSPVFENEGVQGTSFPCVVLCVGSAAGSDEYQNKNSQAVSDFFKSHRARGTNKDGQAVNFTSDRTPIYEQNRSKLFVAPLIDATRNLKSGDDTTKAGEQEGGNGSGGGDAAATSFPFDMIQTRFGSSFWKIESQNPDKLPTALGKASDDVLRAYSDNMDPGLAVHFLSLTAAQVWIVKHREVLNGMFDQIRIVATSRHD